MRTAGMIFILISIIGLFANAGYRIFIWMRPVFTNVSPLMFGIIYTVIIIAAPVVFAASRAPDNGLPRVLVRTAHYVLGFNVYIMLVVNFIHVIITACRGLHILPTHLSVKAGLFAGSAALAVVAGLTVYGAVHALSVRTRRYEITLGGKQEESVTFRIALVSDLHLGYIIEERHIEKVVEAVNAIEPDIICIAGDIFDGDYTALSNADGLRALFLKLEARQGVYACLGNHDAGQNYGEMLGFLSDAGIRVLQDEGVVIDNKFVLAGRKDSWPIGGQGEKRAGITLPPDAGDLPVIVMDHQPGNIGEYGDTVDLVLCGHTHQGQMLPFNLITDAIFDVDYGYYRQPGKTLQAVVTSGAGTWGPPLRVATQNEVAAIQITIEPERN